MINNISKWNLLTKFECKYCIFQNLIMRIASSFDGITIFSKNLDFNARIDCSWCDYVVFPKQCFCEMILERLLLLSTSIVQNLVMRLTMHVFLSFTANTTNYNKNKGKKNTNSFFQEQSKLNKETWIFVLNFYFHHFFQKAFFWRTFFFRCKLSKVYKLIQHNQVLPVSPLTF